MKPVQNSHAGGAERVEVEHDQVRTQRKCTEDRYGLGWDDPRQVPRPLQFRRNVANYRVALRHEQDQWSGIDRRRVHCTVGPNG